MKESNIQSEFGKRNVIKGVFELKLCKGKSLRWDAVKPHQIEALSKACNEGLYHKISDFPMFSGSKTRFNFKKPFDCFFVSCPAYVVVCFYEPRKKKNVYYIDIERYLISKKESSKKSFTEKEAEEMSLFKDNYLTTKK